KHVERVLEPKLLQIGFERVIIDDGWISPEYLFEKNGIWFGCSWDPRDWYLDIALGKLFRFEDFAPRAIVLSSFNAYLRVLNIPLKTFAPYSDGREYFTYQFGMV